MGPANTDGLRLEAGTRLLFLDMDAVETVYNVVRRVMTATKHPDNPLLPLGDIHEWDSAQAAPWASRSIIYDEEDRLFKCWYHGADLSTERWWATGYAYSEDGIHWTKPRLGRHEYNGSKDNNICFQGWGPVIKERPGGDPAQRYKAIIKGPTRQDPIRVAYSADGIHWQEGARIALPAWQGRTPDIVVLLRDDQDPDPQRRYKIVWQTSHPSNKPGPELVRTKCLGYGPDIEHWVASPANPILHPNDGLEHENHFLLLAPYAGQYIMLYEYGWYLPNGTGNFGSYCADIRLAVSRDGEHYTRLQPHQIVIPRGPRGTWDDGMLVISDKLVVKDDTLYLYYCGQGEEWTGWPASNEPAAFRYDSAGAVRLSRMGLATLRRDGFVGLETTDRETPGHLTTAPLMVAEREVALIANVSATQQRRSWVAVEVLDAASNKPLPGFGREDCVPIDRDGVRVAVQWQERHLAELSGSRVKLRCWLYGAARLFALYGT